MPLMGQPTLHTNKSGVLPRYIEDATNWCCGRCFIGYHSTTVNWLMDGAGQSSLKSSKQELMNAIEALTHINTPFLSQAESFDDIKITESGGFDYVPIIFSPGIAIFQRKMSETAKGNYGASTVFAGFERNIPFYVMATVATIIAGMIFWALVSDDIIVIEIEDLICTYFLILVSFCISSTEYLQ